MSETQLIRLKWRIAQDQSWAWYRVVMRPQSRRAPTPAPHRDVQVVVGSRQQRSPHMAP